eukprot:GHVN01003585.1.p1 GENE.GHVN01003585.1~~GHVN01003585.1.p1  ORF type:complete len:382 (-),score=48.80 GHVN01003585.1:117-1262(-)
MLVNTSVLPLWILMLLVLAPCESSFMEAEVRNPRKSIEAHIRSGRVRIHYEGDRGMTELKWSAADWSDQYCVFYYQSGIERVALYAEPKENAAPHPCEFILDVKLGRNVDTVLVDMDVGDAVVKGVTASNIAIKLGVGAARIARTVVTDRAPGALLVNGTESVEAILDNVVADSAILRASSADLRVMGGTVGRIMLYGKKETSVEFSEACIIPSLFVKSGRSVRMDAKYNMGTVDIEGRDVQVFVVDTSRQTDGQLEVRVPARPSIKHTVTIGLKVDKDAVAFLDTPLSNNKDSFIGVDFVESTPEEKNTQTERRKLLVSTSGVEEGWIKIGPRVKNHVAVPSGGDAQAAVVCGGCLVFLLCAAHLLYCCAPRYRSKVKLT